MTDIEARADRVRAIAEVNFGRVIDRNGNAMTFDTADPAPGMAGIWAGAGSSDLSKPKHRHGAAQGHRHERQCRCLRGAIGSGKAFIPLSRLVPSGHRMTQRDEPAPRVPAPISNGLDSDRGIS
jgi:hypothetical protein